MNLILHSSILQFWREQHIDQIDQIQCQNKTIEKKTKNKMSLILTVFAIKFP